MLRVDLNANVLAVLLVLECIAVLLYDIGAFAHPANGFAVAAALSPSSLFVPGVGAVFAFGIAAFIGFESGAIYSEEVRNPRVTVARATFVAVGVHGAVLRACRRGQWSSPSAPADLQKQSAENGPGVVFAGLAEHWGDGVADARQRAVPHQRVRRAAELPQRRGPLPVRARPGAGAADRVEPGQHPVGRPGRRFGGADRCSPSSSWPLFAVAGADPVLELFTWLSGGIAALGVILLMAGTSAAVVGFFRARPGGGSVWQRAIAPTLATLALVALVVLIIGNFDSLIGADPNSPLRWILPGLVLLAAVVGALWALRLKSTRPDVYAAIGTTGGSMDDDESVVLDLPGPKHELRR